MDDFYAAIKDLRHMARGNGPVMRIADRLVKAYESKGEADVDTASISFSFANGKFVQVDTDCKTIAEFFETYGPEGDLADWLVFPNGYALRSGNVDWMKLETHHE